ncbi:hypothetical protein BDFG_09088, partial [Blastomyces dermatitidis ATCC 26199]
SSHIDRFISADDSELNVKSLIENLKNVIMKKLSVLCVTESLMFFSALSVSFSVTSVSGSSLTTPVLTILTSATSGFTVSTFITSSLCFKEILCRLNELSLSRIIPLLNSVEIAKDICVFRNENMNVILFYTCECEAFTSVSEIILIEDDNVIKTILSHSQASSVAFSPFSMKKVVRTLSH